VLPDNQLIPFRRQILARGHTLTTKTGNAFGEIVSKKQISLRYIPWLFSLRQALAKFAQFASMGQLTQSRILADLLSLDAGLLGFQAQCLCLRLGRHRLGKKDQRGDPEETCRNQENDDCQSPQVWRRIKIFHLET
jgi:hypothetical protein